MTIRSIIRPKVYAVLSVVNKGIWLFCVGCIILFMAAALSPVWIPTAIYLWFEEKPVISGCIEKINRHFGAGAAGIPMERDR
jgi:hypothetical protein